MKENFNFSPNCNIDTSVPNKISIRLQPQVTLFKTETKVVLFLLVLFSWFENGLPKAEGGTYKPQASLYVVF